MCRFCQYDEMSNNEMGLLCSTRRRMRNTSKSLVRKPKGKRKLGNLVVNGG